ncbi:lamin tail domain-containing protein [Candidatus Alkanophaga liquidiphilum]
MMRMKVRSALTGLVVLMLVTAAVMSVVVSQTPPPQPTAFSGSVVVDKAAAPADTVVVAEVVGAVGSVTGNVTTVSETGEYELIISTDNSSDVGKPIKFKVLYMGTWEEANETATFDSLPHYDFDLTVDPAPPAVEGLSYERLNLTAINVTWEESTAADVVKYSVYKNGTLLDNTTETYFVVAGLTPPETLLINVTAWDDEWLKPPQESEPSSIEAYVSEYFVKLAADAYEKSTFTGINATYVLTVSNLGSTNATFGLTLENINGAAVAALNVTSVTLNAGENATVLLNVTDAAAGTYNVKVTATCVEDPGASDEVTLTTNVLWRPRINEIMYDAVAPEKDNEWLELYNPNDIDIDITGWSVDGKTIDAGEVPARGYVILANNATAFIAGYGTTYLVIDLGVTSAWLNNDGDTIVLKDAAGNEIDNVTYPNVASENYTAELNGAGEWLESLVEGGTPCEVNSVCYPTVEVLYPNGGESFVVGETVEVSARATDDVGVEGVTFFWSVDGVNWTEIGAGTLVEGDATNGTWSAFWDTSGLSAADTYLIRANATDAWGLGAEDESDGTFEFVEDVWGPVVEFLTPPTPENGSVVYSTWVMVSVNVTDVNGVDVVLLNWNGENYTMLHYAAGIYLYIITNLSEGTYTFYVWANDTLGNWNVSETRTITVIPSITLNVSLYSGWNAIAVPLSLDDYSIDVALSSIAGKYDMLWTYDPINGSQTYYPPYFDDFTELTPGKGYLIRMTESATLTWM